MRRRASRKSIRMAMKRKAYLKQIQKQADEPLLGKNPEEKARLKALQGADKKHYEPLRSYLGKYRTEDNLKSVRSLLKGADISDINFNLVKFSKLGIRNNDLSETDFNDCELNKANFIGMVLEEADFTNADVDGAKFRNSKLKDSNFLAASLTGADFRGADLTNAIFDSVVNCSGVLFTQSELDGVVFKDQKGAQSFIGCHFNHLTTGKSGVSFQNCAFVTCTLANTTIKSRNGLKDCTFDNVSMDGLAYHGDFGLAADLSGGMSIRRANFSGANMSKVSLEDSVVNDTNFSGATMIDADMRDVRAINANFSGADLSGDTHFKGADLTAANFTGADLREANFTGVKSIKGANFTGADLRGADFTGVDTNGAKFKGVKTDKQTKLDVGFIRRKFIGSEDTSYASKRLASLYLDHRSNKF